MTLMDRIIDEAEELAYNRILPTDASEYQIIDAVSEIVGRELAYGSIGGRLAYRSYMRAHNVVEVVIAA